MLLAMSSDAALPTCDLPRMRAERLARLRAEMENQEVDAAVLLHGPNVSYATGFVPETVDASHVNYQRAVAIVTQDRVRLHAHDQVAGLECEVGSPLWPELDDDVEAMRSALNELTGDPSGCRIAVDSVTGAMARAGLFDGAQLVDATRVLGPARLLKTADEVACIERSQFLTEWATEPAREACVVGATRREVAGVFLEALRGLGGNHNEIDPIFQPMPRWQRDGPYTSTGAIAFPTGVGDPVYREGDLVWVDAGHGYEGYASDYGRTWIVGARAIACRAILFQPLAHDHCGLLRRHQTGGDTGRCGSASRCGQRRNTTVAALLLCRPRCGTRQRGDADDRHRPRRRIRRQLRTRPRNDPRSRAGDLGRRHRWLSR